MIFLGPSNLKFPWQPYFDRHVFRNFDFLVFPTKIFTLSLHFCIFISFARLLNVLVLVFDHF